MSNFRTRRFSRARRLLIAGISGIAVFAGTLAAVGSTGSGAAVAFQPTFFPSTAKPAVAASSDATTVEVGVKFVPDVSAYATGIRFYKGAGNTGTHTGTLWNASGVALRSLKFTNETASGWQTLTFPTPFHLTAGAHYVVSYHAPNGHYAFTQGYFTKTIDNGTVKLPASTAQSGNGVYMYGGIGFPTRSTTHATNYWVDLKMSATLPATTTTTKPTTTSGWPTAANTGVPTGVALTNYTGPTTIRSCGVVINAKTVNDDLYIAAGNGTHSSATPCVTIKNSLIKGAVHVGYASQGYGPLLITDTEIAMPIPNAGNGAALDEANFYGWRLEVRNARSNVMCDGYCQLRDSYVHSNYYVRGAHMGGFLSNGNNGAPIVIDHNRISCDMANPTASDGTGGCSGDINFYGDFSQIANVTVTNNYFVGSNDPSYCAYTGANQTAKPYPKGRALVWKNNVWQRGTTGKCGWAGAVFDWTNSGTGNVWCNNMWDTKTAVLPGVTCTT